MPIINKTKRTAAIFNRGREVVKVYDHGVLAWQKSTAIPDYLCFTALEAGQFTLTIPAAVTATYLSYIEWSKDGRTWNHTDNTSEAVTIDVQVAQGEKVYWRGSGNCMTALNAGGPYSSKFSSTCRFDASGNITSLLLGVNYVTALVNYSTSGVRNVSFANLFLDCTTIVNAKDLLIPTFTSYYTYIYYQLFRGCTALVSAPALPSTDAASWCYGQMFQGCTNLLAVAEMLLTSLAANCCRQMYQGCSKITRAQLPTISVLVDNCYYRTFLGCSALAYVKCLATDISATGCLSDWLYGASSTGTFIQAEGVEWPRGASGIPTGWVDVEKRTMPQGYKQVEYAANPNKPNNYPAPNINTGIVLDPTQDTFEIALNVSFDEDGYIAHNQYGGMPFANNSGSSNQYPGTFYLLYRKNATTNTIYYMYLTSLSKGGTISKNGIIDAPQTIRIEHTPTTINMLLNGVSIASKSGLLYDTSTMTTLTGYLYSYNVVSYNWIDPIYYLKWWRSGTMIADYVPCIRENDDEVGFYDFVSNEFKLPTRTGFFTAGEEI